MREVKGLYIKYDTERGRGVFTTHTINKNTTIEVCPVIVCKPNDLKLIHQTHLHDYYFLWGEDQDRCAIALGKGSLYNHGQPANTDFILDYTNDTIEFFSTKDILPGEEILIDYHAGIDGESKLWF